ncbi:MAG: DNA polymerase III subunit gamma/tau [Ruminiclostridium sp.]|nr:DNA polymerase III subunit gamma/tau [Ruminiclostridium sp.]
MYLALYRKYRPRTFDDVISQEHITTTLKNQLKSGQSSHAYLFTGSRGTGKTTCAKILAKALNCTDLRDGNPCLECDSCKSIDEDYSDITEIDAASNNGVDDVRALKEESFYAPMSGKYKVYIIDEVHMLSINAFNALLKLIEEPPPHVVFIFATTEVHKVPATILSRCQRFEFRRIDINDSKKRLLWVAEQEGKKLSEDAAFLISKISEGGMRDALSLLDQCFAVSDDVTEEVVRECAGISGSDYLFRICSLVKEQNSRELLMLLDELTAKSKDVTRLCEELISHYRSLMLIKSGADALAVRVTNSGFEQLKEQSDQYSLEQIMRCLSILSDTFTTMGRVRTPALYLEMCFIKLCTPKLDMNEKSLSARIDRLEQILENGVSNDLLQVLQNKKSTDNSTSEIFSQTPSEYRKKQPDDLKTAVFGELAEQSSDVKKVSESNHKNNTINNEENNIITDVINKNYVTPLNTWQDIISTLPISIRLGVESTTAYISGNNILIDGGKIAVDMALKDYRAEITSAASKALHRDVVLYPMAQSEIKKTPESGVTNKVKVFLDRARSMGIEIKVK